MKYMQLELLRHNIDNYALCIISNMIMKLEILKFWKIVLPLTNQLLMKIACKFEVSSQDTFIVILKD